MGKDYSYTKRPTTLEDWSMTAMRRILHVWVCSFLAVILLTDVAGAAGMTTVFDEDFSGGATPAGFSDFGTPSYSGGQLVLDGSSAIYDTSSPLTATDEFVIEAIVTASSFDTFDFVLANSAGAANSGYGILAQTGSWRGIHMGQGLFGPSANGTGTAYALALVRTGGTSQLYVNGTPIAGTYANVPGAPTQLNIGYNPFDGAAGAFNGQIDRVRLSTITGAFNAGDLLETSEGTIAVVDITNANDTVANAVTTYDIGGTNNAEVVGTMSWTNSLTTSSGTLSAGTPTWQLNGIALAAGGNVITVTGTNAVGTEANDSVTITRLASGVVTSDLIQDLDAEEGVTTSGSDVTAWANQAADGGDDVATGTGAPQLLSSATPSGRAAIEFTNDKLVGDDNAAFDHLVTGGGHTWFVVAKVKAPSGDPNRFFGTLYTGDRYHGIAPGVYLDGRVYADTRAKAGSFDAGQTAGTANLNDGSYHIIAGRLAAGTGTAVLQELFVDSSTADGSGNVDVTTVANTGGELTIAAERIGGGEYFEGDIARILIYDRPLSDVELVQNVTVLSNVYIAPPPVVDVTNANDTVANAVTTYDIGGTNSADAVGNLSWTNSLTGGNGTLSAGTPTWQLNGTALGEGDNVITVTATNAGGTEASDSVTITRLASGTVVAGDLIQDLDAEEGVTTSGSDVTAWANQAVGGGDDMATGAGAPQLLADETPSGRAAIEFTNDKLVGDDHAAFDGLVRGDGYTWFLVARVLDNGGGNNRFFGTLNNGGAYDGICPGIESDDSIYDYIRSSSDVFVHGSGNMNDGDYHVIAGRLAAGTGSQQHQLYVDSATAQNSGSVNIGASIESGALTIGAERTGGNEYGDTDIARLLIYDRPLSDVELTHNVTVLSNAYLVPPPVVDVTNGNDTVANAIATYDIGGTNDNVVGTMSWTNSLTGADGTLSATSPWLIGSIALDVGDNVITVTGTNVAGVEAGDSVTITRLGATTPIVDITNANATVANAVTTITIGGTNNVNVVGTMSWTNTTTMAGGTIPATTPWSIGGIALDVGGNTIEVTGTNASGAADSDSVVINRLGPNIATSGTGKTGHAAADDGSRGTDYANGDMARVNDSSTAAYVDTWHGGNGDVYDWVGVEWGSGQGVNEIHFYAASFVDGGWFSSNGNNDFSGLVAPDVQTTTDGTTWTDVAGVSDDYVSVLTADGHSGGAGQLHSKVTFTFPAVYGVTGIRLIGDAGGNAGADGNGFIGIYELEAYEAPPAAFVDVTNANATVANAVTTYTIGGTNNGHTVGTLSWTNSLTGASGSLSAGTPTWQISGIALAEGDNVITVTGVNASGSEASDSITITRLFDRQILALYTFEGASPAAFDDVSGQGLDPSTIGTAGLDASGYEGQAASFSGGTAIGIPLDMNPGVNPTMTFGAWVRPNNDANRGVFGHDNGGWDRGLDLMGTWRTTGGSNHDSGIQENLADWQFVAVRYSGATGQEVKLNVDTATYSRTLTAGGGAATMVIGAYTVSSVHPFDGRIDNFFIFDDALSDAEIATIRLNGLSGILEIAGLPLVDVTTANDTVAYEVSTTNIVGTHNANVVGTMSWTNSLTGADGTLAAGSPWNISGVALDVGANVITVTGTNAAGAEASDNVTITRLDLTPPVVDITNANDTVDNATTTYDIGGTNNTYTVGTMTWTNSLTGADGTLSPGAPNWQINSIALDVGDNVITVTGTNALGVSDSDSVTITREDLQQPAVDVTNANDTVVFEVTTYNIGGTNNANVAGVMSWTNALTGADGTLAPGAPNWQINGIALGVGANVISVYASNDTDTVVSDSVTITREPLPIVDITNANDTVLSDVTTYDIGGTNNTAVVGTMTWTNSLTGSNGTIAASSSWSLTGIDLDLGENVITVTGTNGSGTVASDTVTVTRLSVSGAQLLGLYPFEGVSPAAFDDVSGQGLDPTDVGTGALDASGYEDQAASFSGSHTPIDIPIDIGPGVNAALTIGTWAKPDTIGQRGVFGHDNGGWDRFLGAGGLSADNWKYPGGSEIDSGIPVTAGAWQFVAVAYNGTTSAKIYVDENSHVSAPHSAGAGDSVMAIGAINQGGTWKYDGLLDNFFIFGETLTDPQIETIRLGGLSGILEVAGLLIVDMTNQNATVAYEVPTTNIRGAHIGVVGTMSWTNNLTGSNGAFAAASPWQVSSVDLDVGINVITVTGTNASGVEASDNVTITRLDLTPPVVDITNANDIVENAITTYDIGGTNNTYAVGTMTWTNSLTGANGTLAPGAPTWQLNGIALDIGDNVITVTGTNALGVSDSDSVSIFRQAVAQPFVTVTNVNETVLNEVTTTNVGGTNNANVVGTMSWTNSLTGGNGTLSPGAPNWQINGIALGVGGNTITVSGTNATGVVNSDSVTITREPPPSVDVTNANDTVAYAVTTTDIGGTNNAAVVGTMSWTNSLTGANGTIAASSPWLISGIALDLGNNVITVTGTNGSGTAASDSVTITRSRPQILALYTFEGASPNAFDDVSGQGLDPNNVGTGALDGSGYEGQAASFSGTHTPIEIPLDISPNSNPTLTIGAWAKPDTVGQRGVYGHDNGGWDRLLAAGGNSADNWKYPGGGEHNSGIAVAAGAWQFVAVAYDETTSAKIYVDANSHVTAPHNAGGGNSVMGIGAINHSGTWKFDGLVDNFFIFGDVLSDADIETIRLNGLSGIEDVAGITRVEVTNANDSVGYAVTTCDIGGTKSSPVVGTMTWTNSLTTSNGSFAAASPWVVNDIDLGLGVNVITVTGTNALGTEASDSVTIKRGNLARSGTGKTGHAAADDGSRGTDYVQSGFSMDDVNDGNTTDFASTWHGGNSDVYDWVGVEWGSGQDVSEIHFYAASFVDGGWFSSNGNNDFSGLVAPDVQTTTDGTTWTDVAGVSDDYVSVLTADGHAGTGGQLHSRVTFTFPAVYGVTGIRLIGNGGGNAGADGNGFLGVYELEAYQAPHRPPTLFIVH